MMNNEIKTLCDRFMAGQTSPDEEKRLAEFFRTHVCTTDEERTLKAMFAWLDADMPMDGDEPVLVGQRSARRHRGQLRLFVASAAAVASVVAVLLIGHPSADEPVAVLKPEALQKELPIATVKNDTTAFDSMRTAPSERRLRKRTVRKYRWCPAPPKVLVAEAAADSASMAGELKADKMLAEMQARQDEFMRQLAVDNAVQNIGINTYVAELGGDETDESEVY